MSKTKERPVKAKNDKVVPTTKRANSTTVDKKPTIEVKPIEEKVKAIITSFMPSAEDRIKNAENFGILTTKFAHLKTKNEELKKFQISSDGSKEQLLLKNSVGFELKVSNSIVMSKVLELLQFELNSLLTSAEKEVKEFII